MNIKKIFLTPLLTVISSAVLLAGNTVYAASPAICDTDVSTGSSGNVVLGIDGSFIEGKQKAIDLINSYRLEACQNGYGGLTMADYVPIQWSDDLEYIARIRATESSITMEHERTNGKSCFEIQSPNGERSWGEVLAWNWSENMIMGIEQWYSEKEDYLNKTDGVTGHYTAMISPENRFVGIATFLCDLTQFYNTTCGEFSSDPSGSSYNFSYGNVTQKIEVIGGDTEFTFNKSNNKFPYNKSKNLSLDVKYLGCDLLTIQDNVSWTSSDSSIISVDGNTAFAKNYGKATLYAKIGGINKSFDVEVIDMSVGDTNTDGSIDSKDAVEVLKSYAVSLTGSKGTVDLSTGDVNKDGKVDSKDAVLILRYYASSLVGTYNGPIENFK